MAPRLTHTLAGVGWQKCHTYSAGGGWGWGVGGGGWTWSVSNTALGATRGVRVGSLWVTFFSSFVPSFFICLRGSHVAQELTMEPVMNLELLMLLSLPAKC